MIKAILFLSALNLALIPVIYLVHVNALDFRDCSIKAYLESDSVGRKFSECTSPRAHFVIGRGVPSDSASIEAPRPTS